MRLATIIEGGRASAAVVGERGVLPLAMDQLELGSMRSVITSGDEGLARIRSWADAQPSGAYRAMDEIVLGPSMPDPGSIYTVGLNYADPDLPDAARPSRPLIYGKAPAAVAGHGALLTWDRDLTANVDPEVELGVVIGIDGGIFGYTVINDISSRDPWLDGDQWLLGKSMPGFCPVGPWIVTPDELDADGLRLGCTIDGVAIQEGSIGQMRYSVDEILAFLGRHVELRPGDLIATGTPTRLPGPLGPERHLEAGDTVIAWIDGIGALTTVVG